MIFTPAHYSSLCVNKRNWQKACLGISLVTVMSFSLNKLVYPQLVTAQELSQSASDQVQLTAIPPRLGEDLSLKALPGQTIQTSVKIRNSSDVTQTIQTLIEDFIIGEDGTEPVPVTEETPSQWSLAKWVTLSPLNQELAPNETALINVLIEVPEDALPGGRYAMIMHQPTSATTLGGAASGIAQRVGTLVYLVVEGPINEEAYITNVQVPKFSEFGPIPLNFSIDNRSDIHIRPSITIEIKNMLGQKSDELNLETKNIFPYTARPFETSWDKTWGFGKYTAAIKVAYGSQGQVITHSTSFWIIPIKLVLALLVGVMTILAVLMLIRRYFKHRNSSQTEHIHMLEEKLRQVENNQTKKFTDDHK